MKNGLGRGIWPGAALFAVLACFILAGCARRDGPEEDNDAGACKGVNCTDPCTDCKKGWECAEGECVCVPQCQDKTCGSDGCSGSCGKCAGSKECISGQCRPPGWCAPDEPCTDFDPCTSNDACVEGTCMGQPYSCDDGRECTKNGCDGSGGCFYKLKSGHCFINGQCYDEGDTKSGNQCRECISSVHTELWSNDDSNPCSDDNECTLDDYCMDGLCKKSGKTLACDDGDQCTDDLCLADAGCTHAFNSAPCDDGDPCTQADECKAGLCAGNPMDCNDGNPCTAEECHPASGCIYADVAGECDDGNLCTLGDTCSAGKCVPGAETLNCDDGNPCTTDGCKPVGGCQHTNNTKPCDDGNYCTLNDVCLAGVCMAGNQGASCDDGNPCTLDGCDSGSGCVFQPAGGSCDDGNICTVGDHCDAGVCVPGSSSPNCDDGNICTDDVCQPLGGCSYVYNTAPCDDGNECTMKDACSGGQCMGQLKVCNDNNVCTTDSCNPFQPGGCTHATNQLPCEDGDPCTLGDSCAGGICVAGGTEQSCNDFNLCTKDFCEPGSGCKHLNIVAYCDDGNPCTDGDYCDAGQCKSGLNVCVCQHDLDCVPYDDGNLCNGALYCDKSSPNPVAWSCAAKPGSQISCSHSADSECLVTKCVPYSGQCVQFPVNEGAPCDDGNQCTSGDHCVSGSCWAPGGVTCNDGDECTTDSCSPVYGCLYKPVLDGTQCGGAGWQCASGQCVPCAPHCGGKECGDDGCGGSCGVCAGGKSCAGGVCVQVGMAECKGNGESSYPDCGEIIYQGCCKDGRVYYCENDSLYCIDCSAEGGLCGWDFEHDFYDCESHSQPDPSGQYLQECPECVPSCPVGYTCVDGDCINCVPNCTNKECGDDGCGGICGQCLSGDICQNGECTPAVGLDECKGTTEPSYSYCAGIDYVGCCDGQGRVLWCEGGALYCIDCQQANPQCGWQAQEGYYDCGTTGGGDPTGDHPKQCTACIPACWPGFACVNGTCMACVSNCAGKECGDDGCGGSCGECPGGYTCQNGSCLPVSACGDVTEAGKCEGDLVIWCQNNQLQEHDCAEEGKQCTYLSEYGKYGCQADCAGVPAEGECDGTELTSCTDSGVEVVECAGFGMGCDWDAEQGKHDCVSGCGNIDYYGQCEGDVLSYCSTTYGNGGTVIVVDCAESGMVCGLENESVGYDCIDACGGVSSYGYCEGDVLHYCDTQQDPPKVVTMDCSLLGLECDLADPVAGYACVDPGGGGDSVVTGTISFDKRTVTQNGFGPTVQVPARQVKVSVWGTSGTPGSEDDDEALGSSFTDNSGNFAVSYDDPGNKVYVVAYAWWGQGQHSIHVDVEEDTGGWTSDWATVAVSTDSFTPAAQVSKSLHIDVSSGSGGFNILDLLLKGRQFIEPLFAAPPSVWVQWDGPQGQYFCWYGTYYDPKEQYIHISNCDDDPDEFDDSVILHEFGHHVSFTLSKDDNPGGPHWVEWAVDPRMAWSEGFASYFGQEVLGEPIYIDASEYDSLVFDLEAASEMCPAKSYLGMQQDICEALVGGVLWDLADPDNTEYDTLFMGPEEIFDVMGSYFVGATFADRGVTGVDFVDFLDGWFCQGHQQYSGLYELIVDGAQFPYDFAGPCAEKLESPVHVQLDYSEVGPGVFMVTARLWAETKAGKVQLKFHLPDGVKALGPGTSFQVDVEPGQIRTTQLVVAASDSATKVAAVVSFSPHEAITYVDTDVLYIGGRPPSADPSRSGRMPDGTPARIWPLR